MSPTSNQIAGFGSCVSSLIHSEKLHIVFSSCVESSSPIECQMKARQEVMEITVESEGTRLQAKRASVSEEILLFFRAAANATTKHNGNTQTSTRTKTHNRTRSH